MTNNNDPDKFSENWILKNKNFRINLSSGFTVRKVLVLITRRRDVCVCQSRVPNIFGLFHWKHLIFWPHDIAACSSHQRERESDIQFGEEWGDMAGESKSGRRYMERCRHRRWNWVLQEGAIGRQLLKNEQEEKLSKETVEREREGWRESSVRAVMPK